MDYQKVYNSLMSSRLAMKDGRKKSKKTGSYFERHHITPLSLGGNRSYAIGSDNIVLLTAREHYIAHRLLWLIYRTREMGFAFHKMVFSQSPLQERRFDSRAYEAARIALSQCQKGENNPMWGKKTWKEGMVHPSKGKKLAPRPHLAGENNPSKSKEAREKISKALTGKERKKGRGSNSGNYGGVKLLIDNNEIVGRFERLEDMLDFVPTSIHNLRNHLRSRKGGLISNRWQVIYEEDYKKSLDKI
jgi:hypothetical protein